MLVTLPAALDSHLILLAFVFYSQSDDFSQNESENPDDMSAHRSDLGLTFLHPTFGLVTVPAALGSHLILAALVFYSQSAVNSVDQSINTVDKSLHRNDFGLPLLPPIIVLVTLPAAQVHI